MKILFLGTPDFAAEILRVLLAEHEVAAVYTQPDRPKGRGHSVQFSPVKAMALETGRPVLQPGTLRGAETREQLAAFNADVFVVAAYGLLLPPKVLALPRYGCINVHASLLPQYRGAAPMQYALLNGDTDTGVTIMRMDRGIDTGDIILQKVLPIGAAEHFPLLHNRMAALGGACILEALSQLENGTAVFTPQNPEAASYAPMIAKEDGRIDWRAASEKIINMTRALDPWPGPYTTYQPPGQAAQAQVIKVWACEPFSVSEADAAAPPGAVLYAGSAQGLAIKTGDGAVSVLEMQSAGGKRLPAADYLRGRPMAAGTVLR